MSQQMELTQEIDENDVIKIMIATDNHLGFLEKHPLRGDDSFVAFEEILQKAVENEVDFILLGGDLFHYANPSMNSLNRCMELLKKYSLGDKPIKVEFLSNQSVNFCSPNKTVNYKDPNINIAIPVFSIHGNHDDPSNFGRLSSMDLLSTNGLLNYFGKCTDLTNVDIKPLLMQKGETKIAIYGLSYLHDNRLARLFQDSKVTFEEEEDGDFFNLLVIHQNRADRGVKNFIPEEMLPDFLHFVLWGHEHDCRIEPEQNSLRKFYVCQPGSSVATSLAAGEAIEKHCGLLLVYKQKFKFEKIKLNTIRPFVFESIDLMDIKDEFSQAEDGEVRTVAQNLAVERVTKMIEMAKEQLTGDPCQPIEPLIRLRLLYDTDGCLFNTVKFGMQFSDFVANPSDVITFKKKKSQQKGSKNSNGTANQPVFNEDIKDVAGVEDIVNQYFAETEGSAKLEIFSSQSLSEFCRLIVRYNDDESANKILNFHKNKTMDFLTEKLPNEKNLQIELSSFTEQHSTVYDEMLKMLDGQSDKRTNGKAQISNKNFEEDVEESGPSTTLPLRGKGSRGRGRGRGRQPKSAAMAKTNIDITIPHSTQKQMNISASFASSRSQRNPRTKTIYIDDSESD